MTTPIGNCCEACLVVQKIAEEIFAPFCKNTLCSCHTTPTDWREDFDEMWKNPISSMWTQQFTDKVKSFIASVEASAIERTRKEVVNYIQNELPKVIGDKVHKQELEEILKEALLSPSQNK